MGPWKTHFRALAFGHPQPFVRRFFLAVAALEWAGKVQDTRLFHLRPVLTGMDLAELAWLEGTLTRVIVEIDESGNEVAARGVRRVRAYVRDYFEKREAQEQLREPEGYVAAMERRAEELHQEAAEARGERRQP